MFQFQFDAAKKCETHTHQDIELFCVLKGQVEMTVGDQAFRLGTDDFLLVNAQCRHSYASEGEALIANLFVSYQELARMLGRSPVVFWCNSTREESERYATIRMLLKSIINEHFKQVRKDELYLNSLYFRLLHELAEGFLIGGDRMGFSEEGHRFAERRRQISDYVRNNYERPVSLTELADQLFLSTAYLSKFIKKQFGMGFVAYVNSIRLEHALTELIYSDKPVVRIAMDTGFASTAALNKVFREKYGTTPSAYRAQWLGRRDGTVHAREEQRQIENRLSEYISENERIQESREMTEQVRLAKDTPEGIALAPFWNRMINIGAAGELLHSDVQEHILRLKETLHFQYVRFWDLYSPQMFLDRHSVGKRYNFGKLDRVLDFLLKNGIRPYIELGEKTKRVLKSLKNALIEEAPSGCLEDMALMEHFMESFASHLVSRYGAEEAGEWKFEFWMKEKVGDPGTGSTEGGIGRVEAYLDRFELVSGILHRHIPRVKVGGSGLSPWFDEALFSEYLTRWAKRRWQPDFLSVYFFPYVSGEESVGARRWFMDADSFQKQLRRTRALVRQSGMKVPEFHVSEWNFTISNRNLLNDSCLKGSYLLKSMIDVAGALDVLGYWIGSDLFADYYDMTGPLGGGSGLLTRDGIPKPAFYAYEFMNRLGGRLYRKGEHCIVTEDDMGQWKIACHNYKHFNYQYCLRDEDSLEIRGLANLLEDTKRLRILFELPARGSREFQVRIYSVNREHGSVQDEWLGMEMPREMSREDLGYLERVSIPRMAVRKVAADGDLLRFEAVLEPEEICYICVSPWS